MRKEIQYYIKTGFWSIFKIGRKAPGLHLNKVVRDIMRECGYSCANCYDGDCNEPYQDVVFSNSVEYKNAAGQLMKATVISLPVYADDAAATADNYPTQGWYTTPTGEIRRKVS